VFDFTVLNVTTDEHVVCLAEVSAMFGIQIASRDLHSSKKEVQGRVL